MSHESYKAVVIGLGPSGAAALKRLNELGISAIGIERKKTPEEPAVCGEFLPDPSEITFISKYPSVKKAFEYIGYTEKTNIIKRIFLEFERYRKFHLKIGGFTISRKEMVNKLIENANVVTGDDVVAIKQLEKGYLVKTRKGREIQADYIVAADGFPSLTRRLLGDNTALDPIDYALGINLKMEVPNFPQSDIYMYSSKDTPGGYAWIIPIGNGMANVGIGIRGNYVKGNITPVVFLEKFIKVFNSSYLRDAKPLEPPRSRWIPVTGFYSTPVIGRTLFVGDALGAVNPINGGGIFTAMALGVLAAESIWLENLDVYRERAWNEIGKILAIGRKYRALVDFLYDHWEVAPVVTRFFPEGLLTKIIKGEETFMEKIIFSGKGRKTSYQPR
jgi:digeranylgeranylglycerophospholipid reductase